MLTSFGGDRYVCDTLQGMRKCLETNNFSYLLGLIEETQLYVDRMEAGLNHYKSIGWLEKEIDAMKKDKKKLEKKIFNLKKTERDLKKGIL